MGYQENADWVTKNVSEIDRIDQLEEECLELIIACKKRKRAMKGTNPTPVTAEETLQEIKEESQDVLNVLCTLGMLVFENPEEGTTERMKWKMGRWVDRVKRGKARKEVKNGKEDGAQGEEPGEDAVQDADGA